MKTLSILTLIIALALTLGSFTQVASAQSAPVIKTLYVGPQLKDCPADSGEIILCYQVKYNPSDSWTLYNDEIAGLDYELGYNYELVVEETQVTVPGTTTVKPYWAVQEVVSAELSHPPALRLPDGVYSNQWQMQNYTVGPGVNNVAAAGVASTIIFDVSGAFWGNAGCNNYGGFFDLPDEGQIKLRDVELTTQNACSDVQTSIEQSVFGAFNSVATYVYTSPSTLILNFEVGPGTLNYFLPTVAPVQSTATTPETLPDPAENEDWTGTSIDDGSGSAKSGLAAAGAGVSATGDLFAPSAAKMDLKALGVKVTANFAGNGRVVGFAGCNFYEASYRAGPNNSLKLDKLVTTKRTCTGPAATVEQKYLDALKSVSGYRLGSAELTVFFNGGKGTITFSLGATAVAGGGQPGMPTTGSPADDHAPILLLSLLALALLTSGMSLRLLRRNNG